MNGLHLVFHIIICIILIFLVLLQKGKNTEEGFLSGNFNRSPLNSGRSPFVVKLTTFIAIAFLVSSFLMTIETTRKANSSVVEKVKPSKTVEKAEVPEDK